MGDVRMGVKRKFPAPAEMRRRRARWKARWRGARECGILAAFPNKTSRPEFYYAMNRQHLLILSAVVLLLGNVGYRVWAHWGLITVHVTDAPLPTVLRSIEKQGGIRLRTNLEPDKTVTMHVEKVPLSYALEVLANVADARVELGYFLAPTQPPIDALLAGLAAGEKTEGWQRFFVPLPPGAIGGADEGTSDPRLDRWEVKPAPEGTLQAYLAQAAKSVSARLEAPADWNPAISSAPKSGEIQEVMPRLAKAAGGTVEQVFLLTGRRRDAAPPTAESGPPEPVRRALGMIAGAAGGDDAAAEKMLRAMGERMQAAIDQMPAEKRAKAQAEFDEGKKFFESMKDLTPEERRAKMEERMQDPATQEKFFSGMAKRDAMKTPQQRTERFRDYLQTKQSKQGAR